MGPVKRVVQLFVTSRPRNGLHGCSAGVVRPPLGYELRSIPYPEYPINLYAAVSFSITTEAAITYSKLYHSPLYQLFTPSICN